ncbi:hypothetical protein ACSBR2_034706 [Camellia fascicularis]
MTTSNVKNRMIQFPSRYAYDAAIRAINRKACLYKLERVDRSQWDFITPYGGKSKWFIEFHVGKVRIAEKVNDRWEICVSLTEGQFQQVSFVNSIATIKVGTHVDYVTNQITNYVMSIVNKNNKNANLKAHAVKNHLWVFVNALIDNPAFDSQTKETLTILWKRLWHDT